jgi:Sulfotransferase domain
LGQAESAKTLKKKLRSKRQEYKRIRKEAKEKDNKAERAEHKRKKKIIEQEIFRLRNEIRAAKEGRAEDEPTVTTGALPDFVIIGTMKGGTSFFYHLLSQHPLVELCAKKELHFFDALFDEGIEWYRQCFPAPRLKDGHRTITGEATPGYMFVRRAPERMARVIPQARLIALLRNPVERAYSHYHQNVEHGLENRTFEEAIGLQEPAEAGKAQPLGKQGENSEGEIGAKLNDGSEYLSRSVYVDQLMRWREFFPREQMLVLKSEDFFQRAHETLKTTFDFLGLPEWEPEVSEIAPKKRNAGRYEGEMDPSTKRRLEKYFEPHNRRLYEFLGKDFRW